MTGTDHQHEAERVRSAIASNFQQEQEGFSGWQRDDLIALAQLHATLALAATMHDVYDAVRESTS